MRNQFDSITFYFPYHEVSGVPVLFFRLANEIVKLGKRLNVYIIDYPDGAMARNIITDPYLTLIPFETSKTLKVPENSILVMQTELPFCIRKELVVPESTRIIFWTLHPNNLLLSVMPFPLLNNIQHKYFSIYNILIWPLRGSYLQKLKQFLKLCIKHNAIWFMDQTTLQKTSQYLFTPIETKEFMPVPASKSMSEIVLPINRELTTLKNNYAFHSEKTLSYFNENHHIDSVLNKFLIKINETSLRYSNIDPKVLNNSFGRNLYLKIRNLKFN